jgi:hypothetical protein
LGIAADTEEFLAAGGKVQEIAGTVIQPYRDPVTKLTREQQSERSKRGAKSTNTQK